jgi:hypothetical protein
MSLDYMPINLKFDFNNEFDLQVSQANLRVCHNTDVVDEISL